MNHWIGGVREPDPEQYVHEALRIYSEATVEMFSVYTDIGLSLLQTVADGDCGIDVCTMILGWERTPANRQKVRDRLCDAAYKSRGNRAFIWLMHSSGEITNHMGLHALDESYCELLEMHGHRAAFAGHHGDGVGLSLIHI